MNHSSLTVDRLPFFQRMASVGTNAVEYMRQRKQPKTAHGLPPGIHWDGPQNVGSKTLLMFTDTQTGDTFSVNPSESTYAHIAAAAVQKRAARQHRAISFPKLTA